MANIIKFEGWLRANKPITDEQLKEFEEYGKQTMTKQEKMIYWQVGEGIQALRTT